MSPAFGRMRPMIDADRPDCGGTRVTRRTLYRRRLNDDQRMLNFLEGAPYGAFAVDMNKTILFWNRGAERILEHKADQALGARVL